MPIRRCWQDGKPGYQYGETGKCYTYEPGDEEGRKEARRKAEKQAQAIRASQTASGERPDG